MEEWGFKSHFILYQLVRMILSVNGPSSSGLMIYFKNKALLQDTEHVPIVGCIYPHFIWV